MATDSFQIPRKPVPGATVIAGPLQPDQDATDGATEMAKTRRRWPWTKKPVREKVRLNYLDRFSGKWTRKRFRWVRYPAQQMGEDPEERRTAYPPGSNQEAER